MTSKRANVLTVFILRRHFGAAFTFKIGKITMENTTENRVAVISIIVEQPQCVNEINEILHSASEYIIGRMGIPYREKNINIISVVIDAPVNIINNVSGKLGRLEGATAKTAYSKV